MSVVTVVTRYFERMPRAKPMLVLAAALVVLNVLTVRTISNVYEQDEREHIDHLIRGSHGRIGQRGDLLTQESLREFCARGSETFQWPGCTPGRLDPTDYSVGGINISTHAPGYYLATGLSARAARAVTPGWESLVTWGRVLGVAWLLLGCYLLLRAGELLGVRRWPLVGAILLAAAVPVQLEAFTTVNPDATAFPAGAAVLLAVLAWERRGRGLWLVAVAAAVAVALDQTNVVAVIVAGTYIALRALMGARGAAPDDADRPPRPWKHYGLAAIAAAVGVVIAFGGWELASRQLSPVPSENLTAHREEYTERRDELQPYFAFYGTEGLTVERLFGGDSLFALVPPVNDVTPPQQRTTDDPAIWYRLFTTAALYLMIGALLAAVFRDRWSTRLSVLGLATLVGMIVAAPIVLTAQYVANDYFEPLVPRYGISALPAIALVLAGLVRTRVAFAVLGTVTVGLYGTALLTLT